MKRQSGITVIEILVGLALSLIILAGVMHIFINNKQTYRVQEAFARLQENGRFAMHFLTKELRMAGFTGCAGKIAGPIDDNIADFYPPGNPQGDGDPDEVTLLNGSGIEGFEHTNLPIQLTEEISLNSADVIPGTDIVRIKRASTTGARVKNPGGGNPVDAASIKLDLTTAQGMFATNDYLFVSDCKNASIFVATEITENPGGQYINIAHGINVNTNSHREHVYEDDAEVFKLVNTTFYVAYNDADQPALFRKSLGNANTMHEEELVEGVEDMQLWYGEDMDGDGVPNKYVESSRVGNWDDIVAVRVVLQVRSIEDNLTKDPTDYKGNEDRRLRRTFTTSIALRNQTI